MGNWRSAGHMRPASSLCEARRSFKNKTIIIIIIFIYLFFGFTENSINKNCTFQSRWEEYIFLEFKGKPMCLVCLETISVMDDFNLHRHNCTAIYNASCCT